MYEDQNLKKQQELLLHDSHLLSETMKLYFIIVVPSYSFLQGIVTPIHADDQFDRLREAR